MAKAVLLVLRLSLTVHVLFANTNISLSPINSFSLDLYSLDVQLVGFYCKSAF